LGLSVESFLNELKHLENKHDTVAVPESMAEVFFTKKREPKG
jgi:hypothetical protein